MKSFALHMKDHSEDLKKFRFSNNTLDYCKSACKICGEALSLTRMREHTKKRHDMVITEYKKKFNQTYYDIIEKVFHKCGICEIPVLFDSDIISSHLGGNGKAHNISHKEYNLKFMVIQQGSKRKSDEEAPNPKAAKLPDMNTKANLEKKKKQESQVVKSQETISKEDPGKTNVSGKIAKNYNLNEVLKPGTNAKKENAMAKDVLEEVDNSLDELADEFENIQSIKSFRSFLALITDPGRDPASYPAIEKILGMDTSSEEAMVEAASRFCSS